MFWMAQDELPEVEILSQIIQKIINALRIFFAMLRVVWIALSGGRRLSVRTVSDFLNYCHLTVWMPVVSNYVD